MTPRLPDFLVIGAFKSGTTALVHCLDQHPDIFMPWIQEPNYFGHEAFDPTDSGLARPRRDTSTVYGRHRTTTGGQYQQLFDASRSDQIAGECSPQYLTHPTACTRIRETVPEAKLIALLRNPIDRAYSDYLMFVRDGLESDSFATAVRRTPSIRPPGHYVKTGMYGRQLQPFFESFPRTQMRIHLYEDWVDDPQGLLSSLYSWLGVDAAFEADTSQRFNASGMPNSRVVALAYGAKRRMQPVLKPITRNRLPGVQRYVQQRLERGLRSESMAPDIRRELAGVYSGDVALLSDLLERDLSHWLAAPNA
jgi:hypothetical protein